MSDQRYDAPASVTVATTAVARSPRVGYVPARTNKVRDGLAIALLVLALLLPWNLDFGLGVPNSDSSLFGLVAVVTILALAAALAPHVGPFRLTAPRPDVRRTSRIRLLLSVPYLIVAVGFVGYHLVQTVRDGGTGLVPPGVGPGLIVGIGGAMLAGLGFNLALTFVLLTVPAVVFVCLLATGDLDSPGEKLFGGTHGIELSVPPLRNRFGHAWHRGCDRGHQGEGVLHAEDTARLANGSEIRRARGRRLQSPLRAG